MSYVISSPKKLCNGLVYFALFFSVPFFTYAATLTVTPSTGSYAVGKNFSVAVNVSSDSQSINAVSGIVNFPKDTLEIVSVSKTSSIVGLWVKEPTYSNSTGVASFEGMVLNPGFTGKSGKLLTYTFRVKKEGSASISLTKGSVLANDGNGTETFSGAGSGTYMLTKAEVVPEIPKASPVPISEEGSNLAALRIVELPRTEDGPIQFSIKVMNTKEVFTRYELRIDQGQPFIWENTSDGIFTLPTLASGSHLLLVKTLDHGDSLTGFIDFSIDAISPPTVDYYTKFVSLGDTVAIHGTADFDTSVTVVFKQGGQMVHQEEVMVNNSGSFFMNSSHGFAPGMYDIEVSAHTASGVQSESISGLEMRVTRGLFIQINGIYIDGYVAVGVLGVLALVWILGVIIRRVRLPQKSL